MTVKVSFMRCWCFVLDDEDAESSNVDGVFQIVNEVWDDSVCKSFSGECSSLTTS